MIRDGQKYAAEFIGTFGLVFAGTGAIIINDVSGGAVTNLGIGLTFGMIVLAMIYAVGDVSGAHLNPAVTLGFFAARRLEAKMVLPYVLSQLLGALARVFFCEGCSRSIRPWEQRLLLVRRCNR
jgi:aquaporin NIP